MLFVLPTPSLQHLAGIKIITALWNRANIFNLILREQPLTLLTEAQEWKAIENRVEANLSALPLPTQLKKHLSRFIKPIGVEISRWCKYHARDTRTMLMRYDSEFLSGVFPRQFHWTMRGTVDYKKTAESIVNNETVDVEKRYVIACRNCLEDDARRSVQRISEERRRQLVHDARHVAGGIEDLLVIFFTCSLSGWLGSLRQHISQMGYRIAKTVPEILFIYSLGCGDRWMWEYLFLKLNPRERENVFRSESQDIFSRFFNLYFLSLMSAEQQERAFRGSSKKILECLLRWPRQSLFLEAAQRGWRLMDSDECSELLFTIAELISSGRIDFDYPRLFWECWRLTPSDYQREFLDTYWTRKKKR